MAELFLTESKRHRLILIWSTIINILVLNNLLGLEDYGWRTSAHDLVNAAAMLNHTRRYQTIQCTAAFHGEIDH